MKRWLSCLLVTAVSLSACAWIWTRSRHEELAVDHILSDLARSPTQRCRLFYEFGGFLNRQPQLTFLDGQKAVCMDPPVAPAANACLVYSFGNNGEWSFDDQMDALGCHVYVFDPSVYSWNHRRSNRTWFYRIGLSDRRSRPRHPETRWRMMTLDDIRLQLNHQERVIDYLKLDIEGDEWAVLTDWLSHWTPRDWNRIKQLAVEVHLAEDPSRIRTQYGLIRQLEDQAGLVRFFSRENPWSRSAKLNQSATCYELAFLNRRYGAGV